LGRIKASANGSQENRGLDVSRRALFSNDVIANVSRSLFEALLQVVRKP